MAEAISSAKLQQSTEGSLSSKRKKVKKDRISSLSDALLCHILSFLPTKYAMRTSILSTRWRYLWTSVPVLHFVDGGEDKRVFMNSVDRVLFFNTVQSIKKFYLKCSWNVDFSRVNAWICVAIMRNVVELDLDFGFSEEDELWLPQNLFRCEKLKVLKLTGNLFSGKLIVLNVPNSLSLSSLKVLHLRYIQRLNGASLSILLSSSPVLEQLKIVRDELDDMWTLHVKSRSLKSLSIQNVGYNSKNGDGYRPYKVVVDASNLEFFEFTDCMFEKLKITQLSSIVEERIGIFHQEIYATYLLDSASVVAQLLRPISNVKFLQLSSHVLTNIYGGIQEGSAAPHNLVTFHNLTHLVVTISPATFVSFDILECMPSVKVIVLHIEDDALCEFSKNVPECLLSCPVMVQLKDFVGSELEMEIAEYFLENAMVLEKMTMSWDPYGSTNTDVLKELLSFTRASCSCQVLFT